MGIVSQTAALTKTTPENAEKRKTVIVLVPSTKGLYMSFLDTLKHIS